MLRGSGLKRCRSLQLDTVTQLAAPDKECRLRILPYVCCGLVHEVV
ncbi:MAG TPA: hypothetical protein O0X54_02785 [Methanocorpusculum sp.]|nr:hypothetical protein [Methanocorpusculum sp.]